MDIPRRPGDDLLEVVRALLLLQGSILVATTIEALFWSLVFPGGGASVALSGAAAAAVLISRARLRGDRRRMRRLVYFVECVTLAVMAIDAALAIALTHALPPAVALLTRLVLPLCVIALLRRATRAATLPNATDSAAELRAVA